MLKCSLDYETRSKCDLKKHGAFRYANDPSTEILCFSLSINGAAPAIWVPKKWRHLVYDKLSWVCDDDLVLLSQPDTTISAFNSMFEAAISQACFTKATGHKAPLLKAWRCVAAMARRAALPASLKKVGEVLNLTEQKDSKGEALIRKFSIPNKKTGQFVEPTDDPESFVEFCRYCLQDTRTEMAAREKLKDFELEGDALLSFQADLGINFRGFPVNIDGLLKAQKIVNENLERIGGEFRQITGLNPTQDKEFKKWLQTRGCKIPNLQAETLEEFLESDQFEADSECGKALRIKSLIGFAALAKIPAMLRCCGPYDNRVRGTHNWHGAGTGRWTAEKVQPHNFKRPEEEYEEISEDIYSAICAGCDSEWISEMYGNPLDGLASSIRHFIEDTGHGPMLDADYSAIEARILAWQAQEEWRLEVFRTHGMIYEASASQMFGVPFESFKAHKKKTGKHHPLRKKGKVAELACGYAGWVGALINMGALKQGLKMQELAPIVKLWREKSPSIVRFWDSIEKAALMAMKTPNKKYPFGVRCSMVSTITAGMKFLFMVLPSGRKIAYPKAELVRQITWWEKGEASFDENGEEIEPQGVRKNILEPSLEQIAIVRKRYPNARISDAITIFSKLKGKQVWGRVSLYAGLLTNNCIQGIAADFMMNGLKNVDDKGYEICALIHDEALSAYHPEKGQSIEEFIRLLTDLPEWAEGMPLKAEGEVVKFYKK